MVVVTVKRRKKRGYDKGEEGATERRDEPI
jgi:hypothetical protein